MLLCPRPLKEIALFSQEERCFTADISKGQVFGIDELTRDILARCPTLDNDAILTELGIHYSKDDILSSFEYLSSLEREGFLFSTEAPTARLREGCSYYLCPNSGTFVADIQSGSGGHSIALHYLMKAVGMSYAQFDVCARTEDLPTEGIRQIPFMPDDKTFPGLFVSQQYDGMLFNSTHDMLMIPLLRVAPIPAVVPLYTFRGHSANIPNQIFLWYSAFRDYDAFLLPTKSIKNFYCRYVEDMGCFHVSHYGVDHDVFFPIDKPDAKRQVAELVQDERVLTMPVVGFLSRLQPEKGGGTYIQLARRIPDALFLAVAPTLTFYEGQSTPDNFLYAGQQPRERLPLFFNAFDMHVFPSVVEEETFGMVALEAMACRTPVVASNFDGIPEVVGDTGILVETETYEGEMGSIAGHVNVDAMEAAIRDLLDNQEKRLRLGEAAYQRSLGFTWDKAARELVELFDELNRRKKHPKPPIPDVSVFFSPFIREDGRVDVQSILSGVTGDKRKLLMFESYIQSVEEGLALALLKNHTWHEVEAILWEFCGHQGAKDVMRRVRQFLETLSTV